MKKGTQQPKASDEGSPSDWFLASPGQVGCPLWAAPPRLPPQTDRCVSPPPLRGDMGGPLSPLWLTKLLASPLHSASRSISPSTSSLGDAKVHQRGPFQSPLGGYSRPTSVASHDWFGSQHAGKQEEEEMGGEGGGHEKGEGGKVRAHPVTTNTTTTAASTAATMNKKQKKKKSSMVKHLQYLFEGGGSSQEQEGVDVATAKKKKYSRSHLTTAAGPTPPGTAVSETTGSQGSTKSYRSNNSVPLPLGTPSMPVRTSVVLHEILRQCISNFKAPQPPKAWMELVAETAGCTLKQVMSKWSNVKSRNLDAKGRALPFSVDIGHLLDHDELAKSIAKLKEDLSAIKIELGLADDQQMTMTTPATTPSSSMTRSSTTATPTAASSVSRGQQQVRGKYLGSPFPSIGQDMVAQEEESSSIFLTMPAPQTMTMAAESAQQKKGKTGKVTTTPSPAGGTVLPMPTPRQIRQVAEETGLGLQEVLNVCKKVREVMAEDLA